jgi:hypothetical protein
MRGAHARLVARLDSIVELSQQYGTGILLEAGRIIEILDQLREPRSLGAHVAAVYGRRHSMSVVIPVPKLLDTEKILLSVMPRKADGTIDTAAAITWDSSDSSKVGIEPGVEAFPFDDGLGGGPVECPGYFNCWALTPMSDAEEATVTVSAPGYESADFVITYAPGVPRSLNASVGAPVSDL